MEQIETCIERIEGSIEALARAYQAHPFDMLNERDSVCFLYHALSDALPNRVPIEPAPDISAPIKSDLQTVRVHSEVAVDMEGGRVDLVVLHDRRYELEAKGKSSDRMPYRFRPPFLTGIELKMSHSKSGQNATNPSGAPKDLKTLDELREYLDTGYVVLLDLTRDRPLNRLYDLVEEYNFATLVHIQLERIQWVRPSEG